MSSSVRIKKLLLFLIGLSILLGLFYFLGLKEIFLNIKNVSILYLILAGILQTSILLVQAFRWGILLKILGEIPKYKDLFYINLIGNFLNRVTLVGYAGEPVRAYLLKKKSHVSLSRGLATIVSERVYDISLLLIMGILGFVYILEKDLPSVVANFIVLLIVGMCLVLIFLFGIFWKKEVLAKFVFLFLTLLKFIPFNPLRNNLMDKERKLENCVSVFQDSFASGYLNLNIILVLVIITFFRWVLALGRTVFILLAIGFPPPLFTVMAVVSLSSLVGLIPTTPGGLGVIESIMVIVYAISGIPADVGAAAAILDRIVGFWLVVFFGWAASIFWKSAG